MSDPHVREVGQVKDIDGVPLAVGVDYDTVTLGGTGSRWAWRLTEAAAEDLAQMFIRACWEAARQGGAP